VEVLPIWLHCRYYSPKRVSVEDSYVNTQNELASITVVLSRSHRISFTVAILTILKVEKEALRSSKYRGV